MSLNSRRVTVSRDCVVVGRFSASRANVPGGGAVAGSVEADPSESESDSLDSELDSQEDCDCVSNSSDGVGERCALSSSAVCSGGVTVGGFVSG